MAYVMFVILMLGSLLAVNASGQTKILGEAKERQPSYGEIENFTIVSYSDLDGWDQVAEFRVSRDGKFAYASNYQGASIVDVSNPERPRVVSRIKNDPSVQSQYIDVLGNTLVVNQEAVRGAKTWESGIRLFDIKDPAKPHEVGFFKTDGPPRRGVHGFWLHEDPKAGKFAFISTTKDGYFGNILIIVDINDPANPKEVSRWWFPGQWTAGGEKRGENWVDPPDAGLRQGLPKIWMMLHDITTYKDRAYLAYRDEGVIILDISDLSKPTKISQIKWSPPEEGNTHSVGIVIPPHGGRPDLIIATDEITRPEQCPFGYMHIIDVRYEKNPVQISTFRLPLNRFCPPDRPGQRFGIHDVERMIKGNIVFSAWENSGFWAVDISDPHRPKSVGYFVPPEFTRVNADSGHADDVYVHNGLVYGSSSDPGGGFWILKYTPGVKGNVSWTADKKNVTVTYEK